MAEAADARPALQRAARHLRWLARRVIEREAECAAVQRAAPPMRYCEVLSALVPFKSDARALTERWQAWARAELGERVQSPAPAAHSRRRHQHGTRCVLADLAHDRTLAFWHDLLDRDARRRGGRFCIRQLAEWTVLQPDGALRITPDCAPRLLTLAECAEAAAGLPEQPAQWQGKPQGPLLGVAHTLGDHVRLRADALIHDLLSGSATGFLIDWRQGSVTPPHDPQRWQTWVRDAQRLSTQHPAIRRAGLQLCCATLQASGPDSVLLRISLETYLDARHLEWQTAWRVD